MSLDDALHRPSLGLIPLPLELKLRAGLAKTADERSRMFAEESARGQKRISRWLIVTKIEARLLRRIGMEAMREFSDMAAPIQADFDRRDYANDPFIAPLLRGE